MTNPRKLRRGAVAVVVEQGKFLVIRRSCRVTAPRAFCFPGGGIEPNESEAQAVIRELREELGAVVRPVQKIWECTTRWNVELHWWLAERTHDQPLVPCPEEVESFHWFDINEMDRLENLLESNRRFLDSLRRGEFQIPNLEFR